MGLASPAPNGYNAAMKAALCLLVPLAVACGSKDGSDEGVAPGSGAADAGVPTRCERTSTPADGPRRVVIGHPYEADGSKGNDYEVLDLSAEGVLTRTGTFFEMGRADSNVIELTSDGQVGIAVQDDGTLGVFRFDDDGVTVVHAAFAGSFYAEEILLSDDGSEALVLDPNWRNNDGGIYRISIACDGTITDHGMVLPSKLARTMRRVPGTQTAVLAAKDVGDSPTDKDVHLIDVSDFAAPAVLGSADAFADEDAASTSIQVTADGVFALVADTSGFGGGNRIGVVALAPALAATEIIAVEDPYDILSSPFGNALAVPSGFGDDIYAIGYDAGAGRFSAPEPLEYVGDAPAIPGQGVVVARGALAGLALVAENVGVRQIRFAADGSTIDLGLFDLGNEAGDDLTAIVSAIGVTP